MAEDAEQDNILVAVRCRPLSQRERQVQGNFPVVRVIDRKIVVILDPQEAEEKERDVLRANRSREKRYAFDYAFDGDAGQEDVYEVTGRPLIESVLSGFNATVFAYGATGTGKTYTMIGTVQNPGIMVLIFRDLFERMRDPKSERVFKCTMTYLEIYNEMIRDLLNPSTEYLDLREDPIKGMCVAGITELEASSVEEVMELLRRGNRFRTQEATAANVVSSRSHAVLQVSIESKERTPDIHAQVRIGKLSLIDLAGSERAAVTQNRGQRMVEGANINRSLLALGNCINALGDRQNRGSFVPYRDSKLTRLLKDSLGGNCRTVMVATLSPASVTFEETHNTLKYANRAKNIKLKVQRNVMNVTYHISQYTRIIADLRGEIAELKSRLGAARAEDAAGAAGEQRRPLTDDGERREMQRLRQDIVLNFQERMQLRRSLIDLEDLNMKNASEVGRRQAEIAEWEAAWPRAPDGQRPPGAPATPKPIRVARSEMQTIQTNAAKNADLREQLERRLRENEGIAKNLRFEMPRRITNADRRELLELEYRIHVLELENMELEEQSLVHDALLRQREDDLTRLMEQIRLRDKVIEEQAARLREQHNDEWAVPSMPALERARGELQKIQLPPMASTGSNRPQRRTGTGGSLYHTRSSRAHRTAGGTAGGPAVPLTLPAIPSAAADGEGGSHDGPAAHFEDALDGGVPRLPPARPPGSGSGPQSRVPSAPRGAPVPPLTPTGSRPGSSGQQPPSWPAPSHRNSLSGSPQSSLYVDGVPRAGGGRVPAPPSAAGAPKAPPHPPAMPASSSAAAAGIYRSLGRNRNVSVSEPPGAASKEAAAAAAAAAGYGAGRGITRTGSSTGLAAPGEPPPSTYASAARKAPPPRVGSIVRSSSLAPRTRGPSQSGIVGSVVIPSRPASIVPAAAM